jgi:predicted short-subunit dehydrogenase-like oxidoreductase (DUF2520 family)
MNAIKSIGIVGYGNVAHQLWKAFIDKGLPLEFIAGRNLDQVKQLAEGYSLSSYTLQDQLPSVDLIIMAVSDDAISTIDLNIEPSTLVCHTSGSKSIKDIQHDRKGVFYALQTFTKDKLIDWTSLPFLIEAEIKEDEERLITLAEQLSYNVRTMNSQQRKTLHLSAVLSCNFANYLWIQAEKICKENQIDFELLHPLIKESSLKIMDTSPRDIQTGPAIRKDEETVQEHIDLLQKHEHLAKLYQQMTQLIQEEFK